MPDKEIIQAVLDAVGVTHSDKESAKENHRCHHEEEECECAVPKKVFYFIFCNCVTINNGACEDWEFCKNCHRD